MDRIIDSIANLGVVIMISNVLFNCQQPLLMEFLIGAALTSPVSLAGLNNAPLNIVTCYRIMAIDRLRPI